MILIKLKPYFKMEEWEKTNELMQLLLKEDQVIQHKIEEGLIGKHPKYYKYISIGCCDGFL